MMRFVHRSLRKHIDENEETNGFRRKHIDEIGEDHGQNRETINKNGEVDGKNAETIGSGELFICASGESDDFFAGSHGSSVEIQCFFRCSQ
jgi:hypothetical protein